MVQGRNPDFFPVPGGERFGNFDPQLRGAPTLCPALSEPTNRRVSHDPASHLTLSALSAV